MPKMASRDCFCLEMAIFYRYLKVLMAVSALRDKIFKDPRHSDILVYRDQKITALTFTLWKMSFLALDFAKHSRGGSSMLKKFHPSQMSPEEAHDLLLKMERLLSDVDKNNMTRPLNIMVLDDDELSLRLLDRVLKSNQHQTVLCTSARSAREQLNAGKSIDVIVCDINLFHENGLAFLSELRLERANLPIIMMSADSNDNTMTQALEMGADGYLIKPFNKQRLLAAIRQAILSNHIFNDGKI